MQALLTRARLPLETIALAVCILDSLDSRFARTWRLSCPLLLHADHHLVTSSCSNKRHTLPPPTPVLQPPRQLHIDSVSPELIVLAALVIAVKFTEDPQEPTQFYCREWGRDRWSHHQLNVTERCIMEKLDYRIMPLCAEDCIDEAMVGMQRAGGRQQQQRYDWETRCGQMTPAEDGLPEAGLYVPSHNRAKTLSTTQKAIFRS